MKIKLFLKFFAGPRMGLLHSSRVHATHEIDQAARQILRALNAVGITSEKERLRLKLRSFGPGLPFADGIFSDGSGSFGFFLYGPPEARTKEVESLLFHSLDAVAFYHAYKAGSPDQLFLTPTLPLYPELPLPVTVVWTAQGGSVPVAHGH